MLGFLNIEPQPQHTHFSFFCLPRSKNKIKPSPKLPLSRALAQRCRDREIRGGREKHRDVVGHPVPGHRHQLRGMAGAGQLPLLNMELCTVSDIRDLSLRGELLSCPILCRQDLQAVH